MHMRSGHAAAAVIDRFYYQLMAKPGGGTAAPPWPDPCAYVRMYVYVPEFTCLSMCMHLIYYLISQRYAFWFLILLFDIEYQP